MKEFGPVNQDRLTTQPDNPKLEVRRIIFMPGEPGSVETPHDVSADTTSQKKPDVRGAIIREGLRRTVFGKKSGNEANKEDQDRSRNAWEDFYKGKKMLPGEQQVVEAIIRQGGKPNGVAFEQETSQQEVRTGQATWRNKGSDQPVNVTGHMGKGLDGRDYVSIEGSTTGIPLDEIEYAEQSSGGGGGQEPPAPPTTPPGGEGGNGNDGDDQNPPEDTEQPGAENERAGPQSHPERGSSIRLYLEQKDINMIEVNPMDWLDSKFNMIYQFVDEGQELASPQINQLQQMFTVGANYISTYATELQMTPNQIKEFITAYNTRLNVIFLRSAIDHRNMESVKQAAERLQASGLLRAFAMEHGNVYRMFGRMGELLEDKRLSQEKLIAELVDAHTDEEKRVLVEKAKKFHVTPEMISNLQQDLINEQLALARKGLGDYGRAYEEAYKDSKDKDISKIENLVEAKIRRAVRTGYDTLVVSQRAAIVVARGHQLPDADRFMSDPAAFFNVYNYEDLLTGKFNIYNQSDKEFLKEMKLFIAKSKLGPARFKELSPAQRLDYGTRMLRDLSAVPDFFSSSWRADGILNSVEARLKVEGHSDKEEDFGLFLRLFRCTKDAHDDDLEKRNARQEVWGKIAQIRPEEIIRLYRERANDNQELTKKLEKFFAGKAFENLRVYELDAKGNRIKDADGNLKEFDAFRTYDKFKKEFGPLVQLLRQEGYKEFRVLKLGEENYGLPIGDPAIAKLNEIVIKYFGGDESKVTQLKDMFAQMSKAASEKNQDPEKKDDVISQLTDNDKFEDIYTRTLLVDDALLDKLESPPPESGITPLSRYWTSEVGGDALVRNFNDTGHAINAHGALLKFVKEIDGEKKAEQAIIFAEETSQYNGQESRANCIKFTIGSFLHMSKQKFVWDALGVSKLPFRKPMSRIEEIYGPAAHSLSMDERRRHVDKIRTYLINAGNENTDKALKELDYYLSITGKDMTKRRAASFLFYLILATVLEAGLLGKSVAKEK